MKWIIHRLQVPREHINLRLDQYLADAAIGLSRTQAKKIIDLGGVHIDGRRVRNCSTSPQPGHLIEVYIDQLPLDPYRIAESDILFQDDFIIVLNKPALVDTQPTHARFKGTVFEALQWHLRDPFRPHQKPEIGMIQRLDRGTSGVIVFSIHPRSHKEMTRIFLEHEVKKEYLALVHGTPAVQQGEIRSFLARSRKENRVKSVEKGGKEAITRYQLVESFSANYSLLNVEILTGRSHQIRAHMSESSWPLVGDKRYGGADEISGVKIQRPLLHAEKLAFRHPVLNRDMIFSVPVPDDFHNILTRLRRANG
ncbi:23S rRNA pseudouridine1911/1915/1917 synthase [Desulfuromusa kysingii]|uniref:Pseudouridine synthase n=1 Tax=Desulfuromusa kysingii TaxID=37625 RepID=A0A1H3YDA9_9BACT|nr:RluA family pseudouridine synthase [Desulfuromusa kysingii]SEA09546.1 23S rRNA pseudouridine1911/1915/1917 synthase [Desulfuromusa kysingii]